MAIKIHPRFESESAAYRAATDALTESYGGLASRNYREAINRETAIQIARLTHWRCTREYIDGIFGDEEGDE